MKVLKSIYIWLTLSVITAFVVTVFFLNMRDPDIPNSLPATPQVDTRTARVFTEELRKYDVRFDRTKQISIEQSLYSYVLGSSNSPNLFTGTVRPGSFSQSKTSEGMKYRLYIDVHPVDITYEIELIDDINAETIPISINCAPQNVQKNTSVGCSTPRGLG